MSGIKITQKPISIPGDDTHFLVTQPELPEGYTPTGQETEEELAELKVESVREIEIDDMVELIQDKLDMDVTPTTGSSKPVTSGGIKTALDLMDDDISSLNEDITNLDDRLLSLATDGYWEETSGGDTYLQMLSGAIQNGGNIAANLQRAYIILEGDDLNKVLRFDSSIYNVCFCYYSGTSVARFTSWSATSPIEYATDITYDKVGITVKALDSSRLDSKLNQLIYYSAETTAVGNLATKAYVVPKQQSASNAGKFLGIDPNGLVVPVEVNEGADVDTTLSVSGEAADAKVTGDTISELAENGVISKGAGDIYYQLTEGMVNSPGDGKVVDHIVSNASNGYVSIPKNELPSAIYYDNTKYKVNTFFEKDGGMVQNTYTTWQTTSPVVYSAPTDFDSLYINVRKLSGQFTTEELGAALYKSEENIVGNLATKDYVQSCVNSYSPKGIKQIYPDGFTSRIKPDIYFNGRFYADIDIEDYKISGTGVAWVATDGNDSTGDGTEDNPYLTITKALTAGATTIHIKAGTYEQGTHYATSVDLANKNVIGHGEVILQNNPSGNYVTVSGNAYIENIIFKHGNATTNPALAATCTASGKTVCFVGCSFRDGGSNGLQLTGVDAVVIGCLAFGNKMDGFNYHAKTVNGTTYIPNVLEIDCKGYDNGSAESGSDSCNGSTAHDGVKIIRLNGEYYNCYGGVIAEIAIADGEPTISVNYGVLSHDSIGTGAYKASFWASVNTKMYLYDCLSYGGTYDLSAINDAMIVSRRLTTGRDVPSVNEASTATVLQY